MSNWGRRRGREDAPNALGLPPERVAALYARLPEALREHVSGILVALAEAHRGTAADADDEDAEALPEEERVAMRFMVRLWRGDVPPSSLPPIRPDPYPDGQFARHAARAKDERWARHALETAGASEADLAELSALAKRLARLRRPDRVVETRRAMLDLVRRVQGRGRRRAE